MNFNYLYYPSIYLPNDAWLRKVLLYSENIASIVPYDMLDSANYNINLLKSENEYTSLAPEEFLSLNDNKEEVQNFKNEVMDYFESKYFQNYIVKGNNKSLLYNSKFIHEIIDLFQSMNIIQEDNKDWWETPKIVGDTYLGILAKHMGSKYNYVPTTNNVKHQNLAFKNYSLPKDKVGELCLLEALPYPSPEVSINDIINFKKKRRQELLKFRTILRENIEKLSKINNTEEMMLNVKLFQEEIELGVNDITQLLKENRITYALESVKTLISLDKELFYKIATGTVFSSLSGASLTTGATIGYVSEVAINISSVVKDYYIQKNDIIRNSPYSYAFYTNKYVKSNLKGRKISNIQIPTVIKE